MKDSINTMVKTDYKYPVDNYFSQQDKSNLEAMNKIGQDSFRDKVFGSLIGSFIGDACGSLVPSNPSQKEVLQSL